MNGRQFIQQLVFVSALTAILVLVLNRYPALQSFYQLAWFSLAFFILLSILMYVAAYKAAMSSNKHNFTNVVLGFVIGKMFLSIMIIILFNKLAVPESKLFLLPFFLVYLIFTVFETYFMMRLGKMETNV